MTLTVTNSILSIDSRRLRRFSLRGLFVLTALCAVATWMYREFYVPPLKQIEGLRVERSSEKSAEVLFNDGVTLQTIEHLLGNLGDGSTLWFYDSQKEALSDPGVFVTITRQDGEYFVEFSNHGWSTNWASVSRSQIVKYMWACRNDNRTGRQRYYRTSGMRLQFDAQPTVKVDQASESDILDHIRSRIES